MSDLDRKIYSINDAIEIENRAKAEAEAEHNAMCETCIHKVSADDIKAIEDKVRQELIEEIADNEAWQHIFLQGVKQGRAEVANLINELFFDNEINITHDGIQVATIYKDKLIEGIRYANDKL